MLNIKLIEEQIKILNYPIIFIFRLSNHLKKIDDYTLSLIIRLFLKHHYIICFKYDIQKILLNISRKYITTKSILKDFYKIVSKKNISLQVVKILKENYNNKRFWNMSIEKQIEFLTNKKEIFLAIYESTRSPIPFHKKLSHLNNSKKITEYETLENIKDRLLSLLKLFGVNLFRHYNIPIIHHTVFYELTGEEVLKYLDIIYNKFNKMLNITIDLFKEYLILCNDINVILNPTLIRINDINIDSDTDINDIKD